jgi:two-component system response regulator FimZ (fimbrial Z protein)
LQKNSQIRVVLKSDDGKEVIDYIRKNETDLVIVDIELPGTDGFSLLKRIHDISPKTKVLFLSSKSESYYAGRAIRAGANGFVSKRKDHNDIYKAVDMLLAGYSFFPSDTLNFLSNNPARRGELNELPLSNREVTVLRYLVNGLTNKEIADQLLLSNKTISAHKSNIFSKLGVHTIVELIDYAKSHELV